MRHMHNSMQVSRDMVGEMWLVNYTGQFEKFYRLSVMLGSAKLPTIGQSEGALIVFGRLFRLFGPSRQNPDIRFI